MKIKIFVIASLACFLSACGAGSTLIVDPYEGEKVNYGEAELVYKGATATVPDKLVTSFHEAMTEEFFEEGSFAKGKGLKVEYRFVQFEEGSQFARWFTGGIGNAGEASLTVKIDFLTPEGDKLSSINVGGKIGSGFFGGSVKAALKKAAKEAADYAGANFR